MVAALDPGTKVLPVSLTRLAGDIPTGAIWLQEDEAPYFLVPCVVAGKTVRWTESDNKIESLEAFDRIFRDEFKKLGFKTGGDPTNLFEDQKTAGLQIGALIKALRVKTCKTANLLEILVSGSGVMDVEWQIYSVTEARVLARVTTEGGFAVKPRKDFDPFLLVGGVFAENVRRLAADPEFRRIVTAGEPVAQTPLASGLDVRVSAGNRAASLPDAVKRVVTIFAGDAMGSGVVISDDGYVLTNHHVAGGSGQVRVRWQDGSSTVGEVVRSDARRDVAIVKTEPRSAGLSIRSTAAQLGETVFAVGTPLDKNFANTLTRGIVSGTRLIDGLPMIQSDVAIDHGNSGGPLLDEKGQILALTVSRVEPDGVGHDINFFIPIADALKALGVQQPAD
jgi:serine protease Do